MDRRSFIKSASAAACSLGAVSLFGGSARAKSGPRKQPNFVVIFIDDMGYGDI
ncbi:MAG: twin-arginine translocation signal domain-containing protein, partial [Phycisphaerae bacterium]|nr:twin-arginine translocation signal domain-containing protein [Phycisphaerae bacterium]